MATPFLSEVKFVSFNFAPKGWALCNGQFLPINQNQALFSLLGTTYGGNGQTNFALPNLQGRVPIHTGQGFTLGQAGGETAHTLSISEMPTHIHQMQATTANADVPVPTGNLLGTVANVYTPPQSLTTLNAGSIGNIGGSQPHDNRSPYLVLTAIIALQGIFPSQN
ncbi:MAG: tail fiber protein [Pseudomonadota bacterium]